MMRMLQEERHFRIAGPCEGLSLFLRHLPPPQPDAPRRAALYVHGATFPSALSVAHRFDGRSWRDELCAAGFDVWGLDLYGFGGSARFPAMADQADAHPALGGAAEASAQVEAAVRFICAEQGISQVSLIAHSWGSMAAGHFAGRRPELVDRLVMFGPIAQRAGNAQIPHLPACAWYPCRNSGTDSSPRCRKVNHPCCCAGISMNGVRSIWTATGTAGHALRLR